MNDTNGLIDIITIIERIILFVMIILLFIVIAISIKSKNKKNEKNNKSNATNSKEPIKNKNYTVESIFDFMEFDKIEDNMVSTKDGTKYVMVIECQGVNYDLMSEMEKNSVEEGFIQFLNTLRNPIQIYTQTRTINLNKSIETYREKVNEIENKLEKERKKYDEMVNSEKYTKEQLNAAFYELTKTINLYEYGKDIIYSTEKMSLNKNVLNQKYYIAIPYYPDELGDTNFDKQEIKNLAFSELYTRAQSTARAISVCGVNAKILNSNELVDLLYIAYNRDDEENYGVDKAIQAGYDELYSTAPDVLDKKIKTLDEKIEKEAFKKANQMILEAKSDKQKELEHKKEKKNDLISQLAELIIEQNKQILGEDIAKKAVGKIEEEKKSRISRNQKTRKIEEGGTKENEQKE